MKMGMGMRRKASSVVAVVVVVAWPSIGEPLLTALPGVGSAVEEDG